MAQDWRISIAIAKHKYKVRENASKGQKASIVSKSDYEKWISKELTKSKQK
jgi:hypothetical protein